MDFQKLPPFLRMIAGAVSGIVCGIAIGLFFSIVIAMIANQLGADLARGPGRDYSIPGFLGMGFGAIVGAILGGIAANKK